MTQPSTTEAKLVDKQDNPQIADRQAALTAAPTTVTGTANGTYDATEQTIINDLVTAVNLLIVNDQEKADVMEAHGLVADN